MNDLDNTEEKTVEEVVEVKEKYNTKQIVSWLAGLVSLLVILGSVYFVYENLKMEEVEQVEVNKDILNDRSVEFQVYSNESLGISFEYPSGYLVSESLYPVPAIEIVSSKECSDVYDYTGCVVITVGQFEDIDMASSKVDRDRIKIDGKDFYIEESAGRLGKIHLSTSLILALQGSDEDSASLMVRIQYGDDMKTEGEEVVSQIIDSLHVEGVYYEVMFPECCKAYSPSFLMENSKGTFINSGNGVAPTDVVLVGYDGTASLDRKYVSKVDYTNYERGEMGMVIKEVATDEVILSVSGKNAGPAHWFSATEFSFAIDSNLYVGDIFDAKKHLIAEGVQSIQGVGCDAGCNPVAVSPKWSDDKRFVAVNDLNGQKIVLDTNNTTTYNVNKMLHEYGLYFSVGNWIGGTNKLLISVRYTSDYDNLRMERYYVIDFSDSNPAPSFAYEIPRGGGIQIPGSKYVVYSPDIRHGGQEGQSPGVYDMLAKKNACEDLNIGTIIDGLVSKRDGATYVISLPYIKPFAARVYVDLLGVDRWNYYFYADMPAFDVRQVYNISNCSLVDTFKLDTDVLGSYFYNKSEFVEL